MKKLTAMLLSLVMCLSLLSLPVRSGFAPEPSEPIIIDVDDPVDPGDPDDPTPQDPGIQIQLCVGGMPGDLDDIPIDG